MVAFTSNVDVGNRALQHCGADRISSFTEDSKRASEVSFVYDKVRVAELQRNVWTFATRRASLRAIDTTTMLLAPALWLPSATYYRGCIVADQTGNLWISNIPSNTGNDPLLTVYWEPYFGPLTVSLYSAGGTYGSGELVYTFVGDGTYRVYLSMQDANSDTPSTATAWDATVTYYQDQIVTYSAVAYKSLVDLNLNQQPNTHASQWTTSFVGGSGSVKWLEIGGAEFPNGVGLSRPNIVYPLGAGPSSQSYSQNIYKLPAGFLRFAPQNPKVAVPMLGGPTGNSYTDWQVENGYIVSSDVGPIRLRFVADVTDVSKMDAMFCEGLAARIGIEVAQPITQSDGRLQTIASMYKKFMDEARTINAIEAGYDDPPDDVYVSVRL
jgi:hypothetical protein